METECLSLFYVLFLISIHMGAALNTCSPGFYLSPSSQICSPCPAGTSQSKFGADGCIPCPPGFITTSKASTKCTPCKNGKTSNKYHTACVCPVGYTLDNDSNSCKICPPGSEYLISNGPSVCSDCSPNSYQPSAGATSCLNCPEGTTSGSGAVRCLTCPAGQLDINGTCGKCSPGFYYEAYTAACNKCVPGTFQDKAGVALACKKCPARSYAGHGFTSCVFCTKRTALMKNGTCASCKGGELYDETSLTCRKCRADEYTPGNNVFKRCFLCGPESHSFMGSTKCVKCKEGTTLLSSGKCGICPDGTYYDLFNSRTCVKCRANSFNSKGVELSCIDCPFNFYALPGSSKCRSCPIGKALIVTSGKCEICPPGKFYSTYAGLCMKCYDGTYKATAGINSCDRCPAGFVSSKNFTACVMRP